MGDLAAPLEVKIVFKVEFQDSDAAGAPRPGIRYRDRRRETEDRPRDNRPSVPDNHLTPPPPKPPPAAAIQLNVDPIELHLSNSGPAKTLRIEVSGRATAESSGSATVRPSTGLRYDGDSTTRWPPR